MNVLAVVRWVTVCLPLAFCAAATGGHPGTASYRAGDVETLRAGFHDPPLDAGPWVYWMFFENVMSQEEITRELEELAAAGIAGAELRFLSMHGFSGTPGPGFDLEGWTRLGQQRLEYLSPEFVSMLEHACSEAQRLGLRLAINLGMGWPPGGPWITDQHRSQHLAASSVVFEGEKTLRGDQSLPVSPGAMIFAWRLRNDACDGQDVDVESFRDLSASVNSQNRLEWDVPDGTWLIGMFQHVPGGVCDKGNGPEADPGSLEAVTFHLDHVFDRLQPRLGKYFGSTFVEVASDSWEYERRPGARYWSPGIFELFPQVAGYDLRQRLHTLLGYGPDGEQTLADVERVERETVRRNFFETTTAYLHARNLLHRPQVRGRGLSRDFFEAFAESDVPEIEEEVFLPEAVWTARTLRKPIVSAEAFTFLSGHRRNLEWDGQQQLHEGPLADPARQWETNLAMLRWHASAHFARGSNRIQMHSFGYSPPGLPPPGWRIYAEVHLNRNVPWWPYLKVFSTWAARTQWVLQSGEPVADALVYPVRSNPPEGPYNLSTDQPASALNAIDGASPYTVARLQAQSEQSPYKCSRLVLIDDVRTLGEARCILKLVEQGAVLVCCHTMPGDWMAVQKSEAASAEVEQLRAGFQVLTQRGMVEDFRGRGWPAAVDAARSVRWLPDSAQLSFQHRRVPGGEVYYVTNWGESFSGEVSFPQETLTPEIWNADTGTSLPAAQYRLVQGRTSVFLTLRPHESTFLVFAHSRPPLHAVCCEGGRLERNTDGELYAWLNGPGPCRVQLSDGRTRELTVNIPDPIALDRPWHLAAEPARGIGVTSPVNVELNKLDSWHTIPELRTFAGITSYQMDFDLSPAVIRKDLGLILELGEVYELADVWVNGRHAGTSWFPPHCLDFTGHVQPGKNALRVDVPNILKHHLEPSASGRPSGLLGPVRIRPVGRVKLQKDSP